MFCTGCWPWVATRSPATSGRRKNTRLSASAGPCSRISRCAGANTTRVAGRDSARRIVTCSPERGVGVGAQQAVEPDDLERLVLVVGLEGDRRGDALALDLDRIAFGDAERLERGARHARDAAAAFLLPRRGDLQPDRALFDYCRCRVRHRPLALVRRCCRQS